MYRTSAKELEVDTPVKRSFVQWATEVNLVERWIALGVGGFILGFILVGIAAFLQDVKLPIATDVVGYTGLVCLIPGCLGVGAAIMAFLFKCYMVVIGEDSL